MMTRAKMLLLSVLAVFAVGAIAVASASALVWEECLNESVHSSTKYTDSHCKTESAAGTWEWMPIEKELPVTSEGGTQIVTIPSAGLTFTCSKVLGEGNILPGGKDETTKLIYHGCTVNIAGCAVVKTKGEPNGLINVPVPIKSELGTLTISGKLLTVDLIKPAVPPTFVVLEVGKKENAKGEAEGACGVLAVRDEMKGSITGMVEGEKLVFTGEGTLTTDGLVGEYKGEGKVNLVNGNLFRASS